MVKAIQTAEDSFAAEFRPIVMGKREEQKQQQGGGGGRRGSSMSTLWRSSGTED
jgi:hypothetical protein